ncbi:MAG: SBBP repeat-containing protein [Bacteroidota bacterium]
MKKIYLISILFLLYSLQVKSINKPFNQSVGYIENKGQIIDQNNSSNPSVKYLYNGNGLNIQLKVNGFSYDTYTIEKKPKAKNETYEEQNLREKFKTPQEDITYHFHRIDIEFIGANTKPTIVAEQANTGYTNYYTAGTNEEGVTFVKTYQKVTYKNLYEGIDLEFVLDQNDKPKYNFIIHPEADASLIKWKYIGANKTSIENDKIILGTAFGNLEERIPISYMAENRANVEVKYQQKENIFSFHANLYNQTQTLIIDPVLWCTYYGGVGSENGSDMSIDTSGNIFVCGSASSSSNIATIGSHQASLGGNSDDGFIVKFNSSGVRLWGTYYGGTVSDEFRSITVDKQGQNIYAGGVTNSTINIATSGAHQTAKGSAGTSTPSDAFLVKFNDLGIRIWGTYYGGGAYDQAYIVTTDFTGNVYLGGLTNASDNIATSGAHQVNIAAVLYYDGFIAKFNASGTRLWGTYYGGTGWDAIVGIVTDVTGNVYACGGTFSTSGIATIGAHQVAHANIGSEDGLVVKFDSLGVRLWGTYYGGTSQDGPNDITNDNNGDIYICGHTTSSTNIASVGAHMPTYAGGQDGFIAKFNSLGVRLWGTYYGGNSLDDFKSIIIDNIGNVFLGGASSSTTNIASSIANQTVLGGSSDGIVVKFNSFGVRLWATYFGGNNGDGIGSLGVDYAGNIYVCGSTLSTSNLATFGAHQTALSSISSTDAFIASFTSSGGLPVKLLSFTGKKDSRNITLTWQTASEINNEKFEIERSFNNKDWAKIGNVKGNGTSSITNQYQFTDNSFSLINEQPPSLYYHLKQIDFDGSFEYSKTVLVSNSGFQENNILPNPFVNELTIDLNSSNAGIAKVKITDVMGREYYNSNENISEGFNQIQVNTTLFERGIYIIQILVNDEIISKKVLKQ